MTQDHGISHIAVIMDGNGRWAQKRSLPRSMGHKKGVDAVREALQACADLNVPYLTLFAVSTENLKRPEDEINGIFGLMKTYLKSELESLMKENVRLRFIGERSLIKDKDLLKQMEDAEKATKDNARLTVNIAICYGSRHEMANAAKQMARRAKAGELDPEDITPEKMSSLMYTDGTPDPDILIRTSGEKRISNFLLWQICYSEIFFIDTLWPDFTKKDMSAVVEEFKNRKRRFGGI